MTRRARFWWAAVPVAVEALAALWWFGRSAGSTRDERRQRLPGDELVSRPTMVTDHALTIDAPPEAVWPWLMQMGWRRAGWYTPRWVDRLFFPGNRASLDRLDPELSRDLAPGDTVPDGPPGTAFYEVMRADRPRSLILHSTTHLPPGWHDRFGAAIDWTWAFVLTESTPGRTRLHLRVRGAHRPVVAGGRVRRRHRSGGPRHGDGNAAGHPEPGGGRTRW
jgi:hypothetical protein